MRDRAWHCTVPCRRLLVTTYLFASNVILADRMLVVVILILFACVVLTSDAVLGEGRTQGIARVART